MLRCVSVFVWEDINSLAQASHCDCLITDIIWRRNEFDNKWIELLTEHQGKRVHEKKLGVSLLFIKHIVFKANKDKPLSFGSF